MDTFTYVLSVNGLLFIMSIVFYFFPPKKINYIYGYRTNRTMLNDDIWNFANSLFCVTLLKYSGITLLVMILMIFINEPLMSSWLPMAFMIFTLLIAIISVEKKINEEFDNEGNRKSRKQ